MKILFIAILLVGILKVTPARADFGGTAFIIGIVVGIAAAEVSDYLDKKDGENNE